MLSDRLRQLPKQSRGPLRRAAQILGVALFLYGVAGFYILPGLVQSKIETLFAERLQRPARVGQVEVNPYTLTLTLRDVEVQEPSGGARFASFDVLHIDLSAESLLRLAPVVRELRLAGPQLRLVRTAPHRYNIDDILALAADRPDTGESARFSINNVQVEGGKIEFDDRPARALHTVGDLRIGIPFISSLPSQVGIFVEPALSATVNGAPLDFRGRARPFADPPDAELELKLDGIDLTPYVGYLPARPRARLDSARLDLAMRARFRQDGSTTALLLDGDAALTGLRVTGTDGAALIRAGRLAVQAREIDVFGGKVALSRVTLDGLQLDALRDAEGRLNTAALLPPAEPERPGARQPAAGVTVALDEFLLRKAAISFGDARPEAPLRSRADKLDLAVRGLVLDTRKRSIDIGEIASDAADLAFQSGPGSAPQQRPPAETAAASAAPAPYAFRIGRLAIANWSARIDDGSGTKDALTTIAPMRLTVTDLASAPGARAKVALRATINQSGLMEVSGTAGMAPLHADLALDVRTVDILPLQSLIADRVNLRITRANLSADGRLRIDARPDGTLQGGYSGEAMLGNVATVDKAGGNDFLRWKSLHAGGIDLRLSPLAVSVEQLALSDFFARVIIDPSGRINLQDIVRAEAADEKAERRPEPAGLPQVAIRRVTLQGGRVRFTDNFIKPNYSATLSQFGGMLSGLSSDPAAPASVDLRGEVSGAPLAVGGRIHPLRGDLFLDIKASVRGMELAPLSAYSGKYVGYGIEKGKLSFEAGYQLDRRKLAASNRLTLEQLTFGDKIESPDATSLPVHFAVALLADRNGVIDIDLPIAGSLDDPQFSIGAILFKLIGNTIVKAVTQPFAMLGALFGGGAELSTMDFDAGRAAVPARGEEKLRALSRALADRGGLKLDIGGRADPEADREGLKQVQLERKLRALKLRDLRARGGEAEPGSVTVNADEYPALLLRAYRDEKFAKPRNVLGLPKDLPVAEMEKLMRANAEIDEDDLLALANQRAQSVKNWLQKNGQVPTERMFIVGAKTAAGASRVEFALR